ncbi:MAG: hypothetical protein U0235_03545 [Polyangiaceae bacterium]
MAIPVFVDFGAHRVRLVGTHGDHVFVALEHYPLVMELDADGAVVRKLEVPHATHVVHGTTIVAFSGPLDGGANRQTPKDFVRPERLAFDFSGARVPVPTSVPDAPHACWIESDGHRLLSLRSILDLPKETYRARVVPIELPSFPLEKATVFFVGDDRVLIEHETRGRFWFPFPKSGLAKGDTVEIGDFFGSANRLVAQGKTVVVSTPSTPIAREIEVPVVKPPKLISLSVLEKLAKELAALGFFDKPSRTKLEALRDDHGLEADEDPLVVILTLLTTFGSPKNGIVSHDHRFEPDEVMRDLAEALRAEGIALPDLRGQSLDELMKRVNLRLEEATATRRVFAVDTKGDDFLYVVCTPSAAADARRLGLTAIALP